MIRRGLYTTAFVALFIQAQTGFSSDLLGRYWAQENLSLEEDYDEPDDLLDSQSENNQPLPALEGRYQFMMVPFAFDVYPIPSYGAQAAYFLGSQWNVELLYGFGGADVFERQVKLEKSALRLNYLFQNFFYVSGGLGMRNIRSTALPSKENDSKSSSVSLWVADFAVGKLWRIETLVIGLDFWGVSIPIRQFQVRGEDLREESSLDEDSEKFQKLAHESTYQALRLRFGVEF